MQRNGGRQYAMAGVPMTPGVRITVSSRVYVPDGEAGDEAYQEPYRAVRNLRPEKRRREITMTYRSALVLLTALTMIFFGLYVYRRSQQSQLCKDISASEANIAAIEKDIIDLKIELAQARDSARISYAAVQQLGMVAASDADTIVVVAPDTRPGQASISQTENSPFSAGHGIISGSR